MIRGVVFGAVAMMACGGGGGDADVAAGSKARAAMCACRDSLCVRQVENEDAHRAFMASFRAEEKVEVEGGRRVPEAMRAIVGELRQCTDAAIDISFGKAVRRKLAVMTEYRDKVCACRDATCAQSTEEHKHRAMSDEPLEEAVTRTGTLGHKPTEDDDRLNELYRSYEECARKLFALPDRPSP